MEIDRKFLEELRNGINGYIIHFDDKRLLPEIEKGLREYTVKINNFLKEDDEKENDDDIIYVIEFNIDDSRYFDYTFLKFFLDPVDDGLCDYEYELNTEWVFEKTFVRKIYTKQEEIEENIKYVRNNFPIWKVYREYEV